MAIQVLVKNYAGQGFEKTIVVEKSAGEYCKDLRDAGYEGIITRLEEGLEAGFTMVIDQFQIEIKQVALSL